MTITPSLQVWYIVDEVSHLIQSKPAMMGWLVINQHDAEGTCVMQTLDKSAVVTTSGVYSCFFHVSSVLGNTRGARRIYLCNQIKKEAMSICDVVNRCVDVADACLRGMVPACLLAGHDVMHSWAGALPSLEG